MSYKQTDSRRQPATREDPKSRHTARRAGGGAPGRPTRGDVQRLYEIAAFLGGGRTRILGSGFHGHAVAGTAILLEQEGPVGQRSFVGEFEQMVLLAILQLRNEAYAPNAASHLERKVGREVSRGALYSCLNQLERKGYLRWRLDEPTPERGGHARRFYKVTPEGLEALRASREGLLTLWQGLEGILGPAK